MWLWIIAAIVAFIAWYAVIGRSWLKAKPWMKGFFDFVEPIEVKLWRKSETILKARTQMLIGVVLTTLTQLGTIDLTPLMPFVSDEYRGIVQIVFNLLPLTLTILGAMDERLRRDTTKPLELVEIADKDVEADPALAAAVEGAEMAKAEAVAVVEVAKAEGTA